MADPIQTARIVEAIEKAIRAGWRGSAYGFKDTAQAALSTAYPMIREEMAKVADTFPRAVPHVVHVPEEDDITSMGTPCRNPAYSYNTTRLSTVADIATAIRATELAKQGEE